MAQPPNNFFAENIFRQPDPVSTPTGAPLAITINPFAEGIVRYTLSCATLGSYVTYFNIVGPNIGTTFEFYLPSVNSLLGQTIVIKNSCPDYDVQIIPSTTAAIDEGSISDITLFKLGSSTKPGAVTLYADPTNYDSWYVTNLYIQP
jgi:hypothetical protein